MLIFILYFTGKKFHEVKNLANQHLDPSRAELTFVNFFFSRVERNRQTKKKRERREIRQTFTP